MTRRDIERFFAALSKYWRTPLDALVIGGAAAVIAGGTRPTIDVDFEATLRDPRRPEDRDLLAGAMTRAEAASGVTAQFSEDISGWSEIAMPPYRGTASRWRQFGSITVRILEPSLYVLTKLRRGTADDLTDLLLVAKSSRLGWRRLAATCGEAVRLSPRSTVLGPFVKRVEHLFRVHGTALWGPRFNPDTAITAFRRTAKLR